MPVDPIINLGLPIVEAYLRGQASRQRQQAIDQDAMARDRAFLFQQQQAGINNQQAADEMALRRQQFDANQANIGVDNARQQAEFDFRRGQFDTGRADEMAARRANTAVALPSLAGGLATGHEQDPFAAMERVQAFGNAPSDVQGALMKQMQAQLQDSLRQRLQRQFVAVGLERSLTPEQRENTKRRVIQEYLEAGGEPLASSELGMMLRPEEARETPMTPEQQQAEIERVTEIEMRKFPRANRDQMRAWAESGVLYNRWEDRPTMAVGESRESSLASDRRYQAMLRREQKAERDLRRFEQKFKLDIEGDALLPDDAKEYERLQREYDNAVGSTLGYLDDTTPTEQPATQPPAAAPVEQTAPPAQPQRDAIDAFIDQMTPEQMMQFLNGAPR